MVLLDLKDAYLDIPIHPSHLVLRFVINLAQGSSWPPYKLLWRPWHARVRLSRGFRLGSFVRAHHTLSVVRFPRHTLSRRRSDRHAPRVRLLQES